MATPISESIQREQQRVSGNHSVGEELSVNLLGDLVSSDDDGVKTPDINNIEVTEPSLAGDLQELATGRGPNGRTTAKVSANPTTHQLADEVAVLSQEVKSLKAALKDLTWGMGEILAAVGRDGSATSPTALRAKSNLPLVQSGSSSGLPLNSSRLARVDRTSATNIGSGSNAAATLSHAASFRARKIERSGTSNSLEGGVLGAVKRVKMASVSSATALNPLGAASSSSIRRSSTSRSQPGGATVQASPQPAQQVLPHQPLSPKAAPTATQSFTLSQKTSPSSSSHDSSSEFDSANEDDARKRGMSVIEPGSLSGGPSLGKQPLAGRSKHSALDALLAVFPHLDLQGSASTVMDVLFIVISFFLMGADAYFTAHYHWNEMRLSHFCITLVCQLISMLWILTKFVTATNIGWKGRPRPSSVFYSYARTWLAFDLFVCFPIECIARASPVAFRILNWRVYLRLLRCWSFSIQQRQFFVTWAYYTRTILNTVLTFIFVTHVFACVFHGLENSGYSKSLYWAVMSLTSVGYGDVTATNTDGRWFSVVVMVCGVALVATITALTTRAVTSKNIVQTTKDEKRLILGSMLHHFRIPHDIQQKVITLFPSVIESTLEQNFHEIVKQYPEFIQKEVAEYVHARMLTNVPIFNQLDNQQLILVMAKKLIQHFVPAFENVINVGDQGSEMFFLRRGIVEILIPGEIEGEEILVKTLTDGAYFGEIALIQECVRTANVRSVAPCELLVLSKDDFRDVIKLFPEFADLLLKDAQAKDTKSMVTGSRRGSLASEESAHVVASKPSKDKKNNESS